MIVDVHNHFYPPAYLDALARGPSNVRITHDAESNPLLHYPGDYNIVVRGHRDIAYRAQVLAEHGVGQQVLTLTTQAHMWRLRGGRQTSPAWSTTPSQKLPRTSTGASGRWPRCRSTTLRPRRRSLSGV
jgi:hypothetical protein